MIVEAAIQEDADVVGLSILSGAHLELFPPVMEGLKEQGREDALVIAGGIIPEDDIPALQQMGIKAVFGPGTSTEDIIDFIQKEAAQHSTR
jgi:methylmalonyl-CoA mutase C-terminal domain/subunit